MDKIRIREIEFPINSMKRLSAYENLLVMLSSGFYVQQGKIVCCHLAYFPPECMGGDHVGIRVNHTGQIDLYFVGSDLLSGLAPKPRHCLFPPPPRRIVIFTPSAHTTQVQQLRARHISSSPPPKKRSGATPIRTVFPTLANASAGNAGGMSAACRPDSQMSALSADTPCRGDTKPIPTQYLRVWDCLHSPLYSRHM